MTSGDIQEPAKERERCYCGRYYPDGLCPCKRMERDMLMLERERRFGPAPASEGGGT